MKGKTAKQDATFVKSSSHTRVCKCREEFVVRETEALHRGAALEDYAYRARAFGECEKGLGPGDRANHSMSSIGKVVPGIGGREISCFERLKDDDLA